MDLFDAAGNNKDGDMEEIVARFRPSYVILRVPLWATTDCDQVVRHRLDFIRHKRVRRIISQINQERGQCEKESIQLLALDTTPLLSSSDGNNMCVDDPWSETVAALDAGLYISDHDLFAIFGNSIFYELWTAVKWREIPKCYGRYTLCRRVVKQDHNNNNDNDDDDDDDELAVAALDNLKPMDFIRHVLQLHQQRKQQQQQHQQQQPLTLANTNHLENSTTTTATTLDDWISQNVASQRRFEGHWEKDPILVVPFLDGGGLLSYEKRNPKKQTDRSASSCSSSSSSIQCQYIHTLNSPSGLSRKVFALGLTVHQHSQPL